MTQLNALPEGFHFLVDLRAELLSWRRTTQRWRRWNETRCRCWSLGSTSAFWSCGASVGNRRRHCWKIAYEAVHPIKSWDDLKNRLSTDRRCFAFFHPRMPNEPLIIGQVALVHGIADNVHTLLDESAPVLDPTEADTAIFYPFPTLMKV